VADTPWLTYDDFSHLLGDLFDVVVDGEPAVALVLAAVTPHGSAEPPTEGTRRPFSLVFTGPASPALTQGIFELRHESLGTVPIFLVPIGPGADGPRYEAVFS
jgi:hypothetical protein